MEVPENAKMTAFHAGDERTRTVDADSYEAGRADGRAENAGEVERLKKENEELHQENRVHREWLVQGFLEEVHNPKKGPMTVADARVYLRKLLDDAAARPEGGETR